MTPNELLELLQVAGRLKQVKRHCWTEPGRQESVADHSWRIALMAMVLEPEFPGTDISKVIRMCLIHDLGEAFTGDIPSFDKTAGQEAAEAAAYNAWVKTLPEETRREFEALLREMEERTTPEARLYKALDNMEAVITHNETDISTWLPLEYELQLTYGTETTAFSDYTRALKQACNRVTREKIEKEAPK